MELQNQRCPVCNSPAKVEATTTADNFYHYVECPVCGNFLENFSQPNEGDIKPKDMDKLAAYLCYNAFEKKRMNYICDRKYFDGINKGESEKAWVIDKTVEAWYPRAFHEKVDAFLLVLSKASTYLGEQVRFSEEKLTSLTFSKRMEKSGVCYNASMVETQREYFLKYLVEQGYVICDVFRNGAFMSKEPPFQLTAKGLQRVDELQKDMMEHSKNVFIAMSFADNMKETREAIRKAILDCGFIPRIMNEIEHNHQIVPEMLYEIRQAKFVVAELTGHNNGAYFEAGYALGLGKDVIQVCQKDAFGKDGHFDVKQVNTILWDDCDDLTARLQNRIKATIV